MNEADMLLRAGDLDGARRVLVEVARRDPGDVPTRLFLWQLLAVAGEWAKAKTQLATLAQLSPEAQMLSVVYGQALDAEEQRAAVLRGELRAPIHGGSAWAEAVAGALELDGRGEAEQAAARREAAFAEAPDTPGTLDGVPFDWIADADPRFGPTIEAVINGRYGLLPFDAISLLVSEGPRDLRDVVWYPVELTLKAGPRIAALLPARYPGLPDAGPERLARATNWTDDGHGIGQRLWSTSDGEDRGLLSIRSLELR
ncbi:tetratricopeptide repeat protein [Sphingomonas sp. PL-96]|uniref:type VI secretion system accessory protein TagJ n=1 Tax=Sphingomonas sp. PL-96 TaxID=2887201 RepID=UPI001E3EDDF1|nr:type VI secretion system accessory protein TagJ [Sphingomonas sp. PL-96]MCC2975686.1 tetratricopeptide repeat protein [Sphingomonas sp. PL-96]